MTQKALKFTCPECGKNQLGSVEQVYMTYPIVNINPDGDLDYDTESPIVGDSHVVSYQCLHCGFELKDEKGHIISDCVKVPAWVKKHCNQDQKL